MSRRFFFEELLLPKLLFTFKIIVQTRTENLQGRIHERKTRDVNSKYSVQQIPSATRYFNSVNMNNL